MTINDKIKQILLDKNLSPSYFADEIGVQRSSISHILSGRNRPSFDIIQKIIRRFPELGYEWIMEEDNQSVGQPGYSNRSNVNNVSRPTAERTPERMPTGQSAISYGNQPTGIRSQRTEIPPLNPPIQNVNEMPDMGMSSPVAMTPSASAAVDKRVERILIFYTDGSFREYTPTA